MTKLSTKLRKWYRKDSVRSHMRAFRNIWISVMVTDGLAQLAAVYHSDLSTSALIALATASVNALVKALFQILLPEFFTGKVNREGTVNIQMTKGTEKVVIKKAD